MGGPAAIHSLTGLLGSHIRRHGTIPFPDFMATALYHPQHGYYTRGAHRIGRHGDFFTSVSVGPLFGSLLARRFLRHWRESGSPRNWRITECGAHDGKLAADILTELQSIDPAAAGALEYAVCEPLPTLQAIQRESLRNLPGKIRFVTHAADLAADPLPGIIHGNELLDALPFHVVEWHGGRWHELDVALDDSLAFVWCPRPVDDQELAAALGKLGTAFPDGYRTEIRPQLRDFLEPHVRGLTPGRSLMLWIDYGFERDDYYHPDRINGTLRTFRNHRAADNPLVCPGESDITAHVDFTAVAEAVAVLGGTPAPLQSQGTWLTRIARDWLLAQEGNPDPKSLRQFQTLTHPAQLGASFQVFEAAF